MLGDAFQPGIVLIVVLRRVRHRASGQVDMTVDQAGQDRGSGVMAVLGVTGLDPAVDGGDPPVLHQECARLQRPARAVEQAVGGQQQAAGRRLQSSRLRLATSSSRESTRRGPGRLK